MTKNKIFCIATAIVTMCSNIYCMDAEDQTELEQMRQAVTMGYNESIHNYDLYVEGHGAEDSSSELIKLKAYVLEALANKLCFDLEQAMVYSEGMMEDAYLHRVNMQKNAIAGTINEIGTFLGIDFRQPSPFVRATLEQWDATESEEQKKALAENTVMFHICNELHSIYEEIQNGERKDERIFDSFHKIMGRKYGNPPISSPMISAFYDSSQSFYDRYTHTQE